MKALVRLLVLLTALASSALLRADGLVRDGVGAISMGRGGTNIAHSDNGAILLDNPAGMMNMTVPGFWEVGLDGVVADLDYSDPMNPAVKNKFEIFPMPTLAYISKSPDGAWAWGIGVFAPAGFGAEYDMVGPLGAPATYRSFGALAKFLPAVAVQVTDRLSVGGTLGLGISRAELEGPFFLQTGGLAGVPTMLDLRATGAAVTGSVGVQYQLSPMTVVGLTYTEESRFRMKGRASADVYGLMPDPLHSNFDAEVDLTWPRSLGIGVKHDLGDYRRVSLDVIWYNWSNAFDQLDMRFTNPDNFLINLATGGQIHDTLPMDWHDTVSYRVGYEWEGERGNIWRIGYVYHEAPVPSSTLNPYLDGVLEHAFTAGFSCHHAKFIFNAAYQYSFGPQRHVGASDIVGGDFDNSTFQAQAHSFGLSLLVPF